MADLICTAISSLDGYIADADGRFDWAEPDPEVHAFVNELEHPAGTYLYGRRMYEVMRHWETAHTQPDQSAAVLAYAAIWQRAEKIVYSSSLSEVTTARTPLERAFDAPAVERLKATATADLSVSGPGLAAHAIRAGLVDEYRFFLVPEVVGGGTRFLPDDVRLRLALLDEHRFAGGTVFLRYRTRG